MALANGIAISENQRKAEVGDLQHKAAQPQWNGVAAHNGRRGRGPLVFRILGSDSLVCVRCFFSRMRSEGSRFILGVWGQDCFRQTLRLCSQPSATVVNRPSDIRNALPCANAAGVLSKVCRVDFWHRSYIGKCRGCVCVCDLCRRSYIGKCRGGVCACV